MLKNGDIRCPSCGGFVEEFECPDVEIRDNDKAILFKVGECNHCGIHYQWYEEYTYEGYRDLEQMEEEGDF